MILLRQCLIIVKLTTTNLQAFLASLIQYRGVLRDLIRSPKRTMSKVPSTISIIPDAMFDIDATIPSIGLGSGGNDLADRSLPIQRETSAGK